MSHHRAFDHPKYFDVFRANRGVLRLEVKVEDHGGFRGRDARGLGGQSSRATDGE